MHAMARFMFGILFLPFITHSQKHAPSKLGG